MFKLLLLAYSPKQLLFPRDTSSIVAGGVNGSYHLFSTLLFGAEFQVHMAEFIFICIMVSCIGCLKFSPKSIFKAIKCGKIQMCLIGPPKIPKAQLVSLSGQKVFALKLFQFFCWASVMKIKRSNEFLSERREEHKCAYWSLHTAIQSCFTLL